MSSKSTENQAREWKIKTDITGVFISGFQIKFVFFSFDTAEENLMMLKKDFAIFSLPFSPFFREMIMMIEEMDLGKVMEE